MLRRDFLFGFAAAGALAAGRRAVGEWMPPDSTPLKQGFVKTSLDADAHFEVHGNPEGFDVLFSGPVFSRTLNPASVKLQTEIKGGYIRHLGDRYRLLMSDYPHVATQRDDQGRIFLSVEDVCKDYLAIADAAGVKRFAAVGYSWGGTAVLQVGTRSNRVAAVVVGGWPAIDGPYDLLLQETQKLHHEHPDRPEIGRYVHYYESLKNWPERAEVAKLTCPRLNFVDVDDGDETDSIGRLRKNKKTLEAWGWETAEVNSGNGHPGGLMPDVACPVIRTFLDKHFAKSKP